MAAGLNWCELYCIHLFFDKIFTVLVVSIVQMSYSRASGVETWISSDGRAYFVQLTEADTSQPSQENSEDGIDATETTSHWQGICIHDIEPPRWVQKQKASSLADDAEFDFIESRRAVRVASNARFSVVATGMQK